MEQFSSTIETTDICSEIDYTEIKLINENGEYTIRVNRTEMDINTMIDQIIYPVLLAAGYSERTLDEYIGRG